MSANVVYVTMSSFIFQQEFHITPILFGWLTAIVGAASVIGKLISPFFIYRLKQYGSLILGLSLLLLAGVALLLFSVFKLMGPHAVLVGASITMFGIVLIGSITMSMALSPFHDKRGIAGSLFGSFQLLISFVVSAFVAGLLHSGTNALTGSYLFLSIFGFAAYLFLVRKPR